MTLPMGLIAMCVGGIFNSIICLVINTHYTGKLIRVGFLVQIRDLFPIFLLSLSMGMVVYLVINIMALPYLLSLIFGVVIGVVYYVSLSRLFRFKEWKELMGLIGR